MSLDAVLAGYIEDNADPELPDKDNAHFGALLLIADTLRALADLGYIEKRLDARYVCDGAFDYFIRHNRPEDEARDGAQIRNAEHAVAREPTRCCACSQDSDGAPICATCRRASAPVLKARAARAGNQPYLLPELQATGSAQGTLFG